MVKIEINNRTKTSIDLGLVKKVASAFGRKHKVGDQEVSLAIVGDAEMKQLNRRYRGLNRPTDVLSFSPLNNTEGNLTRQAGDDNLLGEIIIDYAQIRRQAREFGQTVKQELAFVLVHGLLHLIGYDDKTEAGRRKMVKQGEEFIKNLKV